MDNLHSSHQALDQVQQQQLALHDSSQEQPAVAVDLDTVVAVTLFVLAEEMCQASIHYNFDYIHSHLELRLVQEYFCKTH